VWLYTQCPLVWSALIIVIVALVVAVLAVVARVSLAGESEFWKKLAHLHQLQHDAPFDVVFVGHSIPLCAVDPEVVKAASGGLKSYNASLSTLFFTSAQLWMTKFVLPTLRPRLVVLGLAGLEFNPHSTRMKFMEQYMAAQDLRAQFELANAFKRLVLLCTHPELAKFTLRRLLGRAKEPVPPPADRSVLGPFGDERKHNERTLLTTDRLHEALRDGIFTSYEFAETEVDKLRTFVGAMREAGSEVAVMRLITMPNAVDYYPNGADDYAASWTRVRAVLADLGVSLIECDPSPYDETCFSDVMHMNGRGKTIYSQQLGEALAAHTRVEESRR
jgi:hypothetical protein